MHDASQMTTVARHRPQCLQSLIRIQANQSAGNRSYRSALILPLQIIQRMARQDSPLYQPIEESFNELCLTDDEASRRFFCFLANPCAKDALRQSTVRRMLADETLKLAQPTTIGSGFTVIQFVDILFQHGFIVGPSHHTT